MRQNVPIITTATTGECNAKELVNQIKRRAHYSTLVCSSAGNAQKDPPCVYVVLPNETEKTYTRMIELLSEGKNPNPRKILTDFEKAALNAFSEKFKKPHYEKLSKADAKYPKHL